MPILLLVIILGIVEGVTEYLPVSSTGHLILATELLGFKADEWALFNIAIQPGAILAIVVLYWRTFWDVLVGLFQRAARGHRLRPQPAGRLRARRWCSASRFGDQIEMMLDNAVVVAWALIIGGFAILIVEKLARPIEAAASPNVSFRQSVDDRPGPMPGDDPRRQPLGRDDPRRDGAGRRPQDRRRIQLLPRRPDAGRRHRAADVQAPRATITAGQCAARSGSAAWSRSSSRWSW